MDMTKQQFDLIADQLCNDQESSDEEMKIFLINEGNVCEEVAEQTISIRTQFLTNPLTELVIENGKLTTRTVKLKG